MSATITLNWLESFKNNLKCGPFPSKTSNPFAEMLTGLVGLHIEYLLCKCPTALDTDEVFPNDKDSLKYWYEQIKCGQLFESDAQAWAVFAMAENKLLECCLAEEAEEAEEAAALSRAVTNPAANLYTMVEEDFDGLNDETTLLVTNAAGATVMAPLQATIPVPVGYKVKIIQLGAGAVTFDAEGAATVQGTFLTTGVNDVLFAEKIAINTWHCALLVA